MKDSKDDRIEVNKRSTDKVYFESTLLQRISEGIEFLSQESREILKDLDSQGLSDIDLEEFGVETLSQIDDIIDDMSKFKSELFDADDLPEFLRKSRNDAKFALNRDTDYVRKAQRRLDKLNSDDELVDSYKINIRVIELCDKAIEVNYKNSQAYYLKGLALKNLEKYSLAIEEFVKCLALNEYKLDAWIAIGEAYSLDGDYERAIEVYDSVLRKEADYFDALTGEAVCYFKAGELKKADEMFKKANAFQKLDGELLNMWNSCSE